ncbi:FAD:protein FMN transferase [Ascidiimonas sp. W6]|uniref:FAD:protein FMN transferase n=1 Tax=Ascidiimonas meishanensis TaxID=3128903 RepID=UPI0030EC9027
MKQVLSIGFLLLPIFLIAQETVQKRTVKLMGSRFDISIVGTSKEEANNYIEIAIEEIRRIEKLISSWDNASQTSLINQNAGIKPVKVAVELYDLIERCLQLSKITDGAFDISYASIDKIWFFDKPMPRFPSDESIKKSIRNVGFQHIVLNKEMHTVFLKFSGMKIGFGAIGKGYAADKVRELLKEKGVKGGIINASGDLTTWGKQPNGKDWMVGITNPLNKNKVFSWFPVKNAAVATSGNYEKFVVFNQKKYSHIIDPRSGYPASGLVSVTIFAQKAELCDALATAVFILGVETGLYLINQLEGVECILVDDTNKIHTSNTIVLNTKKA